ncbi:MAG: NHL domain-containing protein [Candidatus Eiseniibacteriota bacterium]
MLRSLFLQKHARVLVPFVGAAAFAIGGCGDDSAGPDPDDGNNPPPDDPGIPYETIQTWMGTGLNGGGPDGLAPLATTLNLPQDLAFAPNGDPYILDWNNHRVRTIKNGVVSTAIGTGEIGDAPDGFANQIRINHPTNIDYDTQGRLILAAWHDSKVTRLDFNTNWSEAIAGTGTQGNTGDGGPAVTSLLRLPVAIACAPTGEIYIMDMGNNRVRVIDNAGNIQAFCGTGVRGYTGDGGPAVNATMDVPAGQAAPPVARMKYANGSLYICDTMNSVIRRIDTATGIITTVAGNGTFGFSGDGGAATSAQLYAPSDVDVDSAGNMYIADTYNNVIRKVDTAGVISTFVGYHYEFTGDGLQHFGGDGGRPADATLDRPYGVAFDAQENFYVVDTHNNRIRVVMK